MPPMCTVFTHVFRTNVGCIRIWTIFERCFYSRFYICTWWHILDNFKRFVVSDLFVFLRDSALFASPLPPYCTIQETLYVFPVYFDVMDISIQKHIKNNCTVQTEKKQSLSRTWSDTISKKGNCTYHSLQHQFIQ